MKKSLLIIWVLFVASNGKAQNLVPNHDFEQYLACPSNHSQLDSCLYWFDPLNTGGAADYYNVCATFGGVSVPYNNIGFQQAKSGDAYSGLYLSQISNNYREYIEVQLLSSLVADSCYHLEMYVNLGNDCRYTTDAIGVYFSSTPIQNVMSYNPLPYNPQINNIAGNVFDTLSWTLVSGNFQAVGGEKYITIGNFRNDANTNIFLVNGAATPRIYCLIDDVSVVKVPACATGLNDSSHDESIKIGPNPFSQFFTIQLINSGWFRMEVTDVTGKLILSESAGNGYENYRVETSGWHEGVYFIKLFTKNDLVIRKLFKL